MLNKRLKGQRAGLDILVEGKGKDVTADAMGACGRVEVWLH
jgi:hypothetical protein